ncbi:ribonuclease HII [Candidatus Nomurabacteria bacterium]|nr:ribonuclease HII [Candidatus Nomurabacteria bacterium]
MKDEYIVGIDEVGRGPIAGPVAVCAFRCRTDFFSDIEIKTPLRDSKKLTKKQREKWFEYLKQEKEKGHCDFAVSMVSAEWIDKVGIVRSIQKALDNSLSKVVAMENPNSHRFTPKGPYTDANSDSPSSLTIFLDGGLKAPPEYINQQTIIKGDELHPVISCASIVAKVTRDNLMTKYAKEYPHYDWDKNMGYGTKSHYAGIKKSGVSILHRKTFLS